MYGRFRRHRGTCPGHGAGFPTFDQHAGVCKTSHNARHERFSILHQSIAGYDGGLSEHSAGVAPTTTPLRRPSTQRSESKSEEKTLHPSMQREGRTASGDVWPDGHRRSW